MYVPEFFAKGTVPEDKCVHHASVRICASSGRLAGPYCPGSVQSSSVRIIGGSPDAGDAPYLYTGSLNNICTVHTSETAVQQPQPGEGGTVTDDTTTDDTQQPEDGTVQEGEKGEGTAPGTPDDVPAVPPDVPDVPDGQPDEGGGGPDVPGTEGSIPNEVEMDFE